MKVKNIMFSGFAAAILMGVAAEASAAPVAVASKGYVDSVAGQLSGLTGTTAGQTNLVAAINKLDDTKLDPVAAAGQTLTDGEYISSVTQTADGQITVVKGNLAQRITSTEAKAPTAAAVHAAIQEVVPEGGVQAVIANGEYTATKGFFNKVTQTNGKVAVVEKDFDTVVNATTGVNTDTAPTTKAVYEAIQGTHDRLDLNQTGGAGKYVQWVKQDNGLVTAQEGTIDTEMSTTSTNPVTNSAIATALEGKQNRLNFGDNLNYDPDTNTLTADDTTYTAGDHISIVDGQISATYQPGTNITIDEDSGAISTTFPAMPAACNIGDTVCVLTSEGGVFKWAVLTEPLSYNPESPVAGTTAQAENYEGIEVPTAQTTNP